MTGPIDPKKSRERLSCGGSAGISKRSGRAHRSTAAATLLVSHHGAGGSASAVGVDWQLAATFSARLRKLLLLPTRRSVLRDPQGPQLLPWHKVTWTQPEWCCCLHNHHGKGRDARNGGCRVQTCCVTAYGTRCHEPCNVWSSMHVCRTKENSRVSFRSHTTHTRPIPRKSELTEQNFSPAPKIRHLSLQPFR